MSSSTRTLLVTSALPYANGPIHIGHLVEYVQTDIWVRFQRGLGHRCAYVCADDGHGTPIMLKAEQEGMTPEALIETIGEEHRADFRDFGISFDNYHTTHSPENRACSELIYARLKEAGHIVRKDVAQAFDPVKEMFLPDRYVKGTCPSCGAPGQYGDNCEVCGATYSPADLDDAVSVLSGEKPDLRTSEHYFVRLADFETPLRRWLAGGGRGGRPPVQVEIANKLDEWFDAGLQDWDISRDAPYFGFEIPDVPGKYFYVWLDAPIGYMGSFRHLCARREDLDFDGAWTPGFRGGALPFRGQGHRVLPHPVLARHAARSGLPHAHGGVRARLPHRQRPEDVEADRHLRQGPHVSRSPSIPSTCATTSRASCRAESTIST